MTVFHTDSQGKAGEGRNTGDNAPAAVEAGTVNQTVIWDRKRDGGFPGMFSLFSFYFILFLFCFLLCG